MLLPTLVRKVFLTLPYSRGYVKKGSPIKTPNPTHLLFFDAQHLVEGTIWYPGDASPSGTIIYIKTSLTGDESVDIREYFIDNPTFPQQSTADQFFDEPQFESYRKLGYSSVT